METKFSCYINKISAMFRVDGTIIPIFDVTRYEPVDEGSMEYRLIIPQMEREHRNLREGDHVYVVISDKNVVTELSIHQRCNELYDDAHWAACPACGNWLDYSSVGIGQCTSISCRAQLTRIILKFLSSIGFPLVAPYVYLLDALLTSGSISSIDRLFDVEAHHLSYTDCTPEQITEFLNTLHNFRGFVTLSQILEGLSIPEMTKQHIDKMVEVYTKNGFTLSDIGKLTDSNFLYPQSDIDWFPWDEFLSTEENKRVFIRLGYILDK